LPECEGVFPLVFPLTFGPHFFFHLPVPPFLVIQLFHGLSRLFGITPDIPHFSRDFCNFLEGSFFPRSDSFWTFSAPSGIGGFFFCCFLWCFFFGEVSTFSFPPPFVSLGWKKASPFRGPLCPLFSHGLRGPFVQLIQPFSRALDFVPCSRGWWQETIPAPWQWCVTFRVLLS